MSFMFGGRPQPSSTQKIEAAEMEVTMITDLFNKLKDTCNKKCIPTDYREGDLNKGESACLDRCVAKYMDVNMKISQRMQEQQQQAQGAQGAQSGGGGGGGGFFGM